MAFKTAKSYNEERYGETFNLRNDGDFADVIFLYQSADDVLVADTHYIKSSEYSGYVHCCGKGCPACGKNIRVQTKLFIPLYNISEGKIQFWDRTMRFEPQLNHDVFANFPNPSEFVFRITRHGKPHDVNTTYAISVLSKNDVKSYSQILADFNTSMPAHYENICKDVTPSALNAMLTSNAEPAASYDEMPSYQVTPRAVVSAQPTYVPPTIDIQPAADAVVPVDAADSDEGLDDNVTF